MENLRERMAEKLRALCYSASPTKFKAINSVREVIANITPILDRVFPDNYDIQLTLEYDRFSYDDKIESCISIDLGIILKFPEILIKNGSGHRHTIKDLYVKISAKNSSYKPEVEYYSINGARGEITDAELSATYRHSHISRFDGNMGPGVFGHFCLGSSMLADKRVWKLNDPLSFEMMLYNIQDLVEWESLGGVPHIRMETLARFSGGLKQFTSDDMCGIQNQIAKLTQVGINDIALKIQDNGYIKVIPTEDFSKNIANSFAPNSYNDRMYNVIKSGDLIISIELLRNNENNDKIDPNEWITFKFKGEKIKPILIKDYEEIKTEELTRYLHPVIEQFIIQQLEREINFQEIKRSEFEQGYTTKVHKEVSEPDQIFVSED
jgi:hypothetical protein